MSWIGWGLVIITGIDMVMMTILWLLELWNRFCRRCSRKHEQR